MESIDCSKLPALRICLTSEKCFDGRESTANCWVVIFTQLLGSLLFLFVFPSVISWVPKSKGSVRDASNSKSMPPTPSTNIKEKSSYTDGFNDLSEDVYHGSSDDEDTDSQNEISERVNKNTTIFNDVFNEEFEDTPSQAVPFDTGCVISTTFRSEGNFLKSNFDSDIIFPSNYKPEYVPTMSSTSPRFGVTLILFMFNSREISNVFMHATGLALLSSAISSVVALMLKYENFREAASCAEGAFLAVMDRLASQESVEAVTKTIDNYKFLPLFLVLAYTAFLVERWREFLQTCYSIQGRLQDIGLLTGSIVPVPVTWGTKKQLYKIYRYLNMVHVLCYAVFIPSWVASKELTPDFGARIGLLTFDEAIFLHSMDNKARDGLLTLLIYEVRVLLEKNDIKNDAHAIVLNQQLIKIRAQMATVHDMFTLLYPNEYMLLMMVLLQSYALLITMGYSLMLLNKSSPTCFQPMVLVGVFFSVLALYIPSAIFNKLRNPFTENSDGIEVKQLIACTESNLFCCMRVLFHREDLEPLRQSIFMKSFKKKPRRGLTRGMTNRRKGGFGEL